MNIHGKFSIFVIILAVLLLGCTSQQQGPSREISGTACAQQDQLCGYGTTSPNTLAANTSQFYGKCCSGYACIGGYCNNISEKCAAMGQFCGYGPVILAHPDNLTYYGECCNGECTNGYCKPLCKTSGSCNQNSECCSGFECINGTCAKPCKLSGSCASNSDCCAGSFCGGNSTCIPEPQPRVPICVEHRGSCTNTSQCCAGLECMGGACTNTTCKWGTACNSTAECCTGLYCTQAGICGVERCAELNNSCNTTEDCCLGNKCENGTCVARTCASLNESCISLSCCSGLTCMNFKCSLPCKTAGVCFKESDCCSGYYCNPTGSCAKLASCVFEYANCTNSSQCCSSLQCNNGVCTKHCKQTGPCSSNAECCAGYLCNQSMQCAPQTTQSTYDLCERECAALGYNTWFCDPETSCGMWGAHLSAADNGCPTAYNSWDYPNNEYCCCENHTSYNCSSACQNQGYANGWGAVSDPSKCSQLNTAIPVDGASCCCYSNPPGSQGYYDFQGCGNLATINSAQFYDMTPDGTDWTQASCGSYAAAHCTVSNSGFSHNCCWWNCQPPQQNWYYCCYSNGQNHCSATACLPTEFTMDGAFTSQQECQASCLGLPQQNYYCCMNPDGVKDCMNQTCPFGWSQFGIPVASQDTCLSSCGLHWFCCSNYTGYNQCMNQPCGAGWNELDGYFSTTDACNSYCLGPNPQTYSCCYNPSSGLAACYTGSCPQGWNLYWASMGQYYCTRNCIPP
ncbi:hypothetical protein H0N98_05145 [Candidatus Micrarchaeota archaeon]|nr:hypothetical protein [Candidatus Micrarchaeota archaeon]